jgi:thymidylate synthase (FAD)
MNVVLIAHTPSPEKVVAASAKLCYSQVGVSEISEELSDDQASSFVEKLMNFGHHSPLEHVSFTFAVEGVSRVLTHQLVRHRIASYSQQSQRYVKLEQFEYIMPPAIAGDEKCRTIFENAMEADQKTYDLLTSNLEKVYLNKYISEGFSEKKAISMAEKSAIEDARFVFPNACETKIAITMNARSLINFFNHRCCNRAQWEIRNLADEMLKIVKACSPGLFEHVGPKCLVGACPEGKMTCGKVVEVREKYAALSLNCRLE